MALLKDTKFKNQSKNWAKMIVKRKLDDLINIIDSYNWEFDCNKFSMILSLVFYTDYSIRFISAKENKGNKLLEFSGLYPNEDIDITVYPKLAEYIKEFRKKENWNKDFYDYEKNKFVQELIEELSPMLDFRNKNISKMREYLGILPMMKLQDILLENWDVYLLYAVDEIKETGEVSTMLGLYKALFGEKSKIYKDFLEELKKETKKKNLKGVF